MDSGTFQLRWDDDGRSSSMIADTDQIAAENLMYLAQDVMAQTAYADVAGADAEVECVTEEVITDDWVQPGGQERIEVPVEHLSCPTFELKQEADLDVPLPTDQDEYTAMRPYPCDFCSRRFRKKASLMNHMVAHQNDRPHGCNLCGSRYVRKTDLMNHLKVHAFVPDNEQDFDELLEVKKKKRGRKKRAAPKVQENGESWENMTSARTQQWSRRTTSAAPAPPAPARSPTPPPPSPPSPDTPPPRLVATDPSRPFVCQTCGVGFAREKALQSHARVHGGESPLECRQCGELCWSRDALASHTRSRHPHLAAPVEQDSEPFQPSDTDSYEEELEYSSEPEERSDWSARGTRSGGGGAGARGEAVKLAPELYCRVCGVAFQRLDLLRRHVVAAHSHKRRESETVGSDVSGTEHTCDVCGEACASSLQLLAHAETHARHAGSKRGSSGGSSGKTFPCRECGKVFGSRSSQQIHVRIHTGERPYGCRFCWKAFADGGTLRKHERIHTGEKPYACAVCPRAFNQRVVLREHVRSHHSAPDHRRSGGATYCCPVCSASLASSSELVQHLIEHCDANTALRRQPQSGPRKYKRRRRIKVEEEPEEAWPPSPPPPREPSPSPSPPPPPPAPRRQKRRPRRPAPPPRPKMIHTEEVTTRPRTKNVRTTTTAQRLPTATFPLMSTEPADDLRAILPQLKKEPNVKCEVDTDDEDGPYRCEMCSLEFTRRGDLLLHVPVHI